MSDRGIGNMLDVLCPMHLGIGPDGRICHAGPTAIKVFESNLIGRDFFDLFDVKRPTGLTSVAALRSQAGARIVLRLTSMPQRQFQGVMMPAPGAGGFVVNLSFGISVVDAVREYNLTAADFAVTDLTVEMLYLVEAKSAAMDASKQLNQKLLHARIAAEEQALTDTLTGLQNRRGIDQELANTLAKRTPFALVHADLDFFKAVNDTFGHAAGDYVLQKVARIMQDETRAEDVVGRVGGDEFVILLKGSEDAELIDRIAQRIIARLQVPIQYENYQCQISGSMGTVLAGDYHTPTADQLLGDADAALYAAKNAGRGRHLFFAPHMRAAAKIA